MCLVYLTYAKESLSGPQVPSTHFSRLIPSSQVSGWWISSKVVLPFNENVTSICLHSLKEPRYLSYRRMKECWPSLDERFVLLIWGIEHYVLWLLFSESCTTPL